MKIAPLIHTRTYYNDFSPEFLVRPDRFENNDIQWARKNVLSATRAIDGLQGERWLVFSNRQYRVAGVVGFLKNICEKCSLEEEERIQSKELFYDDKGRLVYAFIGIVMIDEPKSSSMGNGITCDFLYDFLWRQFLELVSPIWKNTYQKVALKEFRDFDIHIRSDKPHNSRSISPKIMIGNQAFYESDPATDPEIFQFYLNKDSSDDYSFCTNLCDYNLVKQSDFTAITTSGNIINRIKESSISATADRADDTASESYRSETTETGRKENRDDSKKKILAGLMICLMILIIIILILLSIPANAQEDGQLKLNLLICRKLMETIFVLID